MVAVAMPMITVITDDYDGGFGFGDGDVRGDEDSVEEDVLLTRVVSPQPEINAIVSHITKTLIAFFVGELACLNLILGSVGLSSNICTLPLQMCRFPNR